MRIRITLAVACAGLLALACSTPDRSRRQIYFLPLGDFPAESIDRLGAHYQRKFDIAVRKLPALSIEPSMVDDRRNQVVAESLIVLIKRKYPDLESDRDAIVIGLTREDMYIHKYDWQFAFNFRQDKFAVISVARMDPINFGAPPNEDLFNTRLRKMVTKNIGLLYFDKSLNNNPRSVLYSKVGGLEELDNMTEEF